MLRVERGPLNFVLKDFIMASFLPVRDAQLLAWSVNFNALINSTKGAGFGLTQQQATDYTTRHTAFATAYQTSYDPNTRTPPNITIKDEAKKALSEYARELVRIVQSYPSLTDDQRRELKITVRKQRSPQPPPTVRPALTIVSVTGRTVTIKIREDGESSKRGKPAGVLGASVYTYVGNTYPTDPTLWAFDGTTTKTTHQIVFPETVANGAQIWVCAAWFNRKTETGPVSIPVTTNIQGGLGQASPVELRMAA